MTEPERPATKRYRMLLRLLPAEFRGDFGPEMEQVFVEQREEAAREGGKWASGASGGKLPKEFSPPPRASISPCCAKIQFSPCA